MRIYRSACIAILVGGIATAQSFTGSGDATPLKDVYDRYAVVHSVAMKATGRSLVAFKEGDEPAVALFEISYWADGSNFRLNYGSNGVQGLAGSIQVARDGETMQRLDEASSILSYTTRDERLSGAPGPNPFFLPVLFLTPDSYQCPLCDIRLSDLGESGRWPSARLSDSDPSDVFVKPQSPQDSWAYQVTLGHIGKSVVPLAVQRTDPNGKVLVEVTMKDFRDFGDPVGMIPLTVETRSLSEDGKAESKGTWKITELQINGAIDPSLFRLKQDDAKIVIDDDTGLFLKHPQSSMVGRSMKDLIQK